MHAIPIWFLLLIQADPVPATLGQPADSEAISRLLRGIVLEVLPHEYENTKKWGQTRQVLDGFGLQRRDDGRVHFVRRTKPVNHGTWTRYRVDLVEPDQKLRLEFARPREAPGGGLRFDLSASADLEVFARLSEWRYDVQLYSFNALSQARVRLDAVCDVRLQLDAGRFPPDFIVETRVEESRIELQDFELQRVSQVRGAVAHELGKLAREVLEDYLAEHRGEITAKLNKSLAKNRDKMRLSLADSASSLWQKALPPP